MAGCRAESGDLEKTGMPQGNAVASESLKHTQKTSCVRQWDAALNPVLSAALPHWPPRTV